MTMSWWGTSSQSKPGLELSRKADSSTQGLCLTAWTALNLDDLDDLDALDDLWSK
jgi:hypothetical protein